MTCKFRQVTSFSVIYILCFYSLVSTLRLPLNSVAIKKKLSKSVFMKFHDFKKNLVSTSVK